MTSTERVHASRRDRPRTEELYRAMSRVLQRLVQSSAILRQEALEELEAELEGVTVGPEKRRLTTAEREAIARRLLEGDRT